MIMDVREIRVELLLSKHVLDPTGKSVGRIEEICAEQQGDESVVREYLIGPFAVLERLSAWTLGLPMLDLLRWGKLGTRYRVPWDKLDLTDPERPRLRCPVEDLDKLPP
jgi:sporulation protein YlmC with PRC-barrel domain